MEQRDNARTVNYLFTIDSDKDVVYSVQSTNLGAFMLGTTPFSTQAKEVFLPSNKIDTEPLILEFIISEDFREWIFFFKWMMKLKNNNSAHLDWTRACTIQALNSQGKPTLSVTYLDAFPFMVDDVQFSTQGQSTVLTMSVTMRYNKIVIKTKDGETIDENWNGYFK